MLNNIQALRCFAALAVVWHHAMAALSVSLGLPLAPIAGYAGRAGVDVFFVVSGFVMFHATRESGRSVVGFWSDRLIRIAPMYWLGVAVALMLMAAGLGPLGVERTSLQDVAANLAFMPDVRVDGSRYPILNVGWTLSYEMYF